VPRRPRDDEPLLAYCHMGKAGGKRLSFYLRCHFGVRHLLVIESFMVDRVYTCEELRLDLRWNPFLRSIGGHTLKPFVDFSAAGRPLRWYTILRNPIDRSVCHYLQQMRRGQLPQCSLGEWLQKYPRRTYWQVQMLAGERNLARAKETLLEKFVTVGLTEFYEESLFLFAWKLGLKNFRFNDGRRQVRPGYLGGPARARSEAGMIAEARKMEDELRDRLSLDFELYEFARKEFFEKQVGQYGRAKFEQDLRSHLSSCKTLTKWNRRYLAGRAFDLCVYRPVIAVRRRRARKRPQPD